MVGQFAEAGKGFNILASPSLQGALTRALTMRAELQDQWDRKVQKVAKSFNLVSKRDVTQLKRHVRDLENLVATLEHQLQQQTIKTNKAEQSLKTERNKTLVSDAKPITAAPKKPAAKKTTAKKTVAKKTTAKKATAKKTTAKKTTAKKATAKKTTAKKATAKKATAKKATAKKATAKKATAKKSAAKKA